MKTINGKKPLSSKGMPALNVPSFFRNPLQLNPEVAQDIASKGLEARFINYKEYTANGNDHGKGWKPYMVEKKAESSDALFNGTSVDGTIRRKELILAVRPKEWGDEHRAHLKDLAKRASGKKKELKQRLQGEAEAANFATSVVQDEDES